MTLEAARIEYSDHGGWLGEVPTTWRVGPLRRFCNITLGKMVTKDEGVVKGPTRPYVRAAHVQPSGVWSLTDIKEMAFTSNEATRLTLLRGDVVVVEGGAGFGRSAVLREALVGWGFQNSINRVRVFDGDGRFANYALLAAQASGHFETLINTATIPHLTAEKLADVQVAWPEGEVQRQIADYLDVQTGKIDALTGKQERLIETLAERRQAVISHAVTKGLNPNVPMKESGVEWLGVIPSNWVALSLNRLISNPLKYGANEAAVHDNPEWPRYIRITDFGTDGALREETFRSLPPELAREYSLKGGDILLARSGATAGKSFLVPNDISASCFAGYLIRVSLNRARSRPRFISYFLSSSPFAEWRSLVVIQATIENISAERYARMPVPVPSVEEQDDIVEYLDRETAQIDALSAKAREMIDVLKERRQALISAAVTGKIDVRGLT